MNERRAFLEHAFTDPIIGCVFGDLGRILTTPATPHRGERAKNGIWYVLLVPTKISSNLMIHIQLSGRLNFRG